ncbi:MAG: DUF5696 domain-containing protein [Candidatus Izemoplasmatales bacterium]
MDKINANEPLVYSALPLNQKLKVKIKNWFNEKIHEFKFPWKKLIVIAVIALIGLGLYLVVKLNKLPKISQTPYDKTDFLEVSELKEQYSDEVILENTFLKFTLSTKDTLFTLEDKSTGEIFTSNPDTRSSRFLDPLRVAYAGNLGSVSQMGVYSNAIDYDDFLVKVAEDYIEVLYLVGGKKGVDEYDFPQVITAERMEDLVLSKLEEGSISYRRVTEQAYVYGEVEGEPIWKLKSGIQTSILERLYTIFYEEAGYTAEDLTYDLESNGIKVEDRYPYFEVALRYSLSDNALDVRLVNEAFVEKEKYPMVYIDILPYFSAGTVDDEGYLLIPDGSGGIIEFNQERAFSLPYNKRIYGDDLASFSLVKTEDFSKINLPVFGIKNNDKAMIAIAEETAEMANIYANSSTQDNPYNYAYYRYNIREGEIYEFSSISSSVYINEWTYYYNQKDFKVKYVVVDEADASYADMAKTYQDYLLANDLVKNADNTSNPVLDLTLLGGYMIDENFLGIPYETVKSLTDTEGAKTIIEALSQTTIEDINIYYQGFTNEGLKPSYMGDIQFDRSTGSRNDFQDLVNFASINDIELFLESYINSAYTKKDISIKNEAVRDVFGEIVYHYDYNPASLFVDSTSREKYILSPHTYNDTFREITKVYERIGTDNIAYSDFGKDIYGSYKKDNTIFRYQTAAEIIQSLEENTFAKQMFRNPNLFAIKYANNITDIDILASNYQVISYSVPFYQLVFSGLVDYSGDAFNTDDKYSYNYHVMKAIETTANIAMTWSYESTVDLVETEYSKYYSTFYEYWLETLSDTHEEMVSLGVYSQSLTDHEVLSSDGLVTMSTYSNGKQIVFNYRDYAYSQDGFTVEANSYLVIEEGS